MSNTYTCHSQGCFSRASTKCKQTCGNYCKPCCNSMSSNGKKCVQHETNHVKERKTRCPNYQTCKAYVATRCSRDTKLCRSCCGAGSSIRCVAHGTIINGSQEELERIVGLAPLEDDDSESSDDEYLLSPPPLNQIIIEGEEEDIQLSNQEDDQLRQALRNSMISHRKEQEKKRPRRIRDQSQFLLDEKPTGVVKKSRKKKELPWKMQLEQLKKDLQKEKSKNESLQFKLEESTQCKICYADQIEISFGKCGHCLCKKCHDNIITKGTGCCPHCRMNINRYNKAKPIYFS